MNTGILTLVTTGAGSAHPSIGPEVIWDAVLQIVHGFLAELPQLFIATIALVLIWVSAMAAKRAIRGTARRARWNGALALALARVVVVVIWILGLLLVAVILFPSFQPAQLVAGLGVSSIAIGFAFKDLLQNFLAGLLLLWREPFHVGDQIRSGGFEGTVEEIDMRATRLTTYDGERAIIPNSDVYTNVILVRTAHGSLRVHFDVPIDKNASVEDTRALIGSVLDETQGVLKDPPPSVYLNAIGDGRAQFVVYFWTAANEANVTLTSDRAMTAIKHAMDEARIATAA